MRTGTGILLAVFRQHLFQTHISQPQSRSFRVVMIDEANCGWRGRPAEMVSRATSIPSNHPIKPHLIAQMGNSSTQRRAFREQISREAEKVLIHVWQGKTKGSPHSHPLAPLGL